MKKLKKLISVCLIVNMLFVAPIQALAANQESVGENSQNEALIQSEAEQGTDISAAEANGENSQDQNATENATAVTMDTSKEEVNDVVEADNSANEDETTINKVIDYVYVESADIEQGNTENIVISLLNRETVADNAELTIRDSNDKEIVWEMTKYQDGIFLFSKQVSLNLGTYKLQTLTYYSGEEKYLVDLQGEGIEGDFSVVEANDESENQTVETSVQVMDDDGNLQEVSSISEGIALAQEYSEDSAEQQVQGRKAQNGNTVIVLDPGHDNTHTGAAYDGINEEKYTLQIAKACRAVLEQYSGVEVYLTVEENGNTRWPGVSKSTCLENRVKYAKELGADLFVSFHLNSADASAARGVEVFVSNYSKYRQEGTDLANKVLDELGKVGLSKRPTPVVVKTSNDNVYYDDGNKQDYLSVIRNSSLSGFPSILIEHGFITNSGDANIIKNYTTQLGQADAKAIVEHLNLKKGAFGISPSNSTVAGNTVTLKAYSNNIASGYNQYRFIYYDGISWKAFNDFSSNTAYEWVPKKAGNNYILGLEAKNSAGDVKQYITWSYYTVSEPTVKINGVNVQEEKNGMSVKITPQVETNSTSLKYKYLIYNVDNQVWKTIKDTTSDTSAEWIPEKSGNYLIHIIATSVTGKEITYTTSYAIDSNRAYIEKFTADKSSMKAGQEVTLKAEYETLADSGNKYQFLVYNGSYWSDISGENSKEVTWKPKKEGSYLLCFQITTESGKVYQAFNSLEVTKKNNIKVNGIHVDNMNAKGEIKLSADVITNGAPVTYTFKEYDMSKWSTISENSSDKNVTWTPKKSGNHLLYLEVNDEDGESFTYNMGCSVPTLVKITSFNADKKSPQGIGNTIKLSAKSSITKNIEASYEYMYYNGKAWFSIQKSSEEKDAVWTPKDDGNYLLCYQIVTEAGEVYQSFIRYEITEPKVDIKGINVSEPNTKGEITLKANVDTDDSGLIYTYKEYDMSTWSIIAKESDSDTVAWKPKSAGNYLLYLEINGSTGKVYTYCMGCTVRDEVKITGLEKSLNSPQVKKTEIKLNGEVSALFPESLEYDYMVYDGQKWSHLTMDEETKTAEWKPEKEGNYALCFQVTDKSGQIYQWFESYVITAPSININGISIGNIDKNKNIKLKANVTTNDSKITYTYKVYDMNEWKTIVEKSDTPEVTWNVDKEGTYLLYLDVVDSFGDSHTYSMGVTVNNNVQINAFITDLSSPQKISDDLSIQLSGDVQADYTKGLTFRYMSYDGNNWQVISEGQDKLEKSEWKPRKEGSYLLCLQVVKDNGEQINSFLGYTISTKYYIMGTSNITVDQMVKIFTANNSNYDKFTKVSGYDGCLAAGGAPTITDFCRIFKEEAEAEGVKVEVAFAQAMLETGYLKFGGDVKPNQYNFAGLGATGNGVQGNVFGNVREGIRAQIQHLKCYASTDNLNNPCVDQRWNVTLRGKAPTVEDLTGTWAASATYAQNILALIEKLKKY